MIGKPFKFGFAASLLALGAGGCANMNSISRTTSSPAANSGKIFTVDAKQRHLVMSRVGDGEMRVCAEAAPDVFSAFATSAAAQGNKSGGQFSLGSSETAATIERTQTINLLRESFYRTCERYLSGAISKTTFIVQAARDQKSMVAILAIEQLTGAYRPRSTIISPGGTAASVISGEKAADLIRDYDAKLASAKAEHTAAQNALQAEQGGICVGDAAEKPTECTALEATVTAKKGKEEEAQKALNTIVELAKNLVSGGTASTSSGRTFQGGGLGATKHDAARMKEVADAVVKIAAQSSIDEPLMFCIGYLGEYDKSGAAQGSLIAEKCLELLQIQQGIDTQYRQQLLTNR